MEKIILNFTPTGMIPTKAQTPHVPLSSEEIIADVKRAVRFGVTMVHIHVRDENGQPCHQKELYERVILGIREFAQDLVVCVSTSGRTYSELSKRADALLPEGDAKPDMASLTLSSINFNTGASVNEPSMIQSLAAIMKEKGIRPEMEAFDSGMINYAKYLIKKGLISPPYYFNLILGNIACAQANLLPAGLMVSELPDDALFSFGGIGAYQLRMNSLAISMGYGVRVGLEDNIWLDNDRTVLASNSDLLERVVKIAAANQKEIMSPSEFREKMKLKKGFGAYGADD